MKQQLHITSNLVKKLYPQKMFISPTSECENHLHFTLCVYIYIHLDCIAALEEPHRCGQIK